MEHSTPEKTVPVLCRPIRDPPFGDLGDNLPGLVTMTAQDVHIISCRTTCKEQAGRKSACSCLHLLRHILCMTWILILPPRPGVQSFWQQDLIEDLSDLFFRPVTAIF